MKSNIKKKRYMTLISIRLKNNRVLWESKSKIVGDNLEDNQETYAYTQLINYLRSSIVTL